MESKAHEKIAIESEKCIIAVAISDNKVIPLIADQLKPEFFYDRFCHRLWKIIVGLYSSEDGVDQIMVGNVLSHNKSKSVGEGTIVDLARICSDYWIAPATIEAHVKTVREAWHKRTYIHLLTEYQAKANDSTQNTARLNDEFSQKIRDMDSSLELGQDQHISGGIESTMAEWGDNRGPSTGLKMLDEITGGFIPGDYHIYAARASMGKTALMCNFIRSAALIERVPTLGFSLEMSRARMQTRLIGAVSKISPKRLFMKDNIQPNEDMRIGKARNQWMDSTFYLDDQSGLSIEQLRYRTRRNIQEHGIKLVLVDYLQLCTVEAKTGNREQEVARITEGLKAMGKDLNVCVVAFSQLSRETDKRPGNRPRMSDLRESGAIEQSADIVGFIHRPEYYGVTFDDEHGDMKGKAYIYVDKQRNGEVGEVECTWNNKIAQFSDGG